MACKIGIVSLFADMEPNHRMGVDWETLAQAVRDIDVTTMQTYARDELAKPATHFTVVKRALEEYCFSRVRFRAMFPWFANVSGW